MASHIDRFRARAAVWNATIASVAFSTVLSAVDSLAQGMEPSKVSAEAKARGWKPYEVYLHAPYKSSSERIELLYKAIKEEIRDPTKLREDDVHWVEHQSILGELAFGVGESAQEAKEGEFKLRNLLATEINQEVKDLLRIALGHFGDKSVWRDLVGIMKQKGRPLIRESAARALYDCNARLAIPELIEALKDSEVVIQYVPTSAMGAGVKSAVFRVSGMALTVLKYWGVKVETPDKALPCEFKVDKESAAKALKAELQNSDNEHVKQAIEAIARVGGPAAKAELKRFIQEREGDPGKADLTAKAREVLSRMETGTE